MNRSNTALVALLAAAGAACVPGEFGGPEPITPRPSPTVSPSPRPSVSPTPSPTTTPQPSPSEPTFGDHWNPTGPADQGPGDLVPVIERDGKSARRLSVAQLRASIPALFGVTWTNNNRATGTVMFNSLSRTLGEADYLALTDDNLDPTPIFAKFMDDMAGQVCANAVTADNGRTDPATRVVTPFASDVPRNLRYLRLKLHGIHVPDTSEEGLGELRKLYDDILADTRSADQAWTGVCVAMVTSPEFMAY